MRPSPLPHSFEIERAVLGAILLQPTNLDVVRPLVTLDDFHIPAHQAVWRAMLGCTDRGVPVDTVSLDDQLHLNNEHRLVGGIEKISALTDHWSAAAHLEQHADRLHEIGIQRRIVLAGRTIATEAMGDVADVNDLIATSERQLAEAAESASGSSLQHASVGIPEVIKTIVEARKTEGKSLMGAQTSLEEYNQMCQGLQPADVTILAARPSMGKTSLALGWISDICMWKPGEMRKEREHRTVLPPALVFSLEMRAQKLQMRMLAAYARLSFARLSKGNIMETEMHSLVGAASALHESDIYFDDSPTLSISQIRSAARRWRRKVDLGSRGLNCPGVIMVDYLQLVAASRERGTREQEVAEVSRGLKAMARETGCHVLGLSQLNRGVDSRDDHRPRLSDLRESGAIEQDADVITFIFRPEQYVKHDPEQLAKVQGLAELIVGKNRNGPTGIVRTHFLADQMRFVPRSREHEPR